MHQFDLNFQLAATYLHMAVGSPVGSSSALNDSGMCATSRPVPNTCSVAGHTRLTAMLLHESRLFG